MGLGPPIGGLVAALCAGVGVGLGLPAGCSCCDDPGSGRDDPGSGSNGVGPDWDETAKLGLMEAELMAPLRTALWAALFLAITDDGFGAGVDDGVGAVIDVGGRSGSETRTTDCGDVGGARGDRDVSFPGISGT